MPKREPTVYGLDFQGVRKIVAAPSYLHAAKLLEVSSYILKTHGGITRSSREREIALSDPGAVFAQGEEDGPWAKLTTSWRSRRLPTRGGPRPSGGKPREGQTVAQPKSVRLSDAHYAAFRELGGTTWFRRELRKAEPLPIGQLKSHWNIQGAAAIRSVRLSAEDHERFIELGGTRWLRVRIEECAPEHDPSRSPPDPPA